MQCVAFANRSSPHSPSVAFSIAFARVCSGFNLRFAWKTHLSFWSSIGQSFHPGEQAFVYTAQCSVVRFVRFWPIVWGWTHKHVCPTVYRVDLESSTQLHMASDLSKQKETSVSFTFKCQLLVAWGCVKLLQQTRGTSFGKQKEVSASEWVLGCVFSVSQKPPVFVCRRHDFLRFFISVKHWN